jgi:hypothetical protein
MDQHDLASVTTRRRWMPGGVAVLVVALALSTAGCLAPAPGGLQNGFLPDSVLQVINPNCKIWKPAASSLLIMMAFAHSAGVELTPESCYRSYADQVAVRNYWCSLGLCQFAAVPGTSVHGWGKAVDFQDQAGELTFSSVGYAWLKANASSFCFVHPAWAEPGGSAPEPWHWEWVCG